MMMGGASAIPAPTRQPAIPQTKPTIQCSTRSKTGIDAINRPGRTPGEQRRNEMKTYYQVIVKNGEVVDSNLCRIRPITHADCGHKHRSPEAAEACRTKLSDDGRSAKWYIADVVELAADGHYPPTEYLAEC
jgi:hypothetical protein